MLFFLPLLFESCNRLQFHGTINSEGLRPDLSNNGSADKLKLIEFASLYEAFAVTCVEFCLDWNIRFVAVFFEERKHVLVDDIEFIPSSGHSLQTRTRYDDAVCFDKLRNLHKGVSDSLFLTYLADNIHNGVAECLLEIHNVSDYLLELKPVVGLELVQEHLFVEIILQLVVEKGVF